MIFGMVQVNIGGNLDIGSFFRITDVGSVVRSTIAAALLFASITFVLYFLWSALRWLSSGGDKSQVEMARQRLTNAFIGLTLVAAAWAVFLLIIYILGLPITTA